jgi:hypothetical protein
MMPHYIRNFMLLFGIFLIVTILLQSCESEEYSELEEILKITSPSGATVTDNDLNALPELIQKHMRFSGVVGTPRHNNLKMSGSGKFKQSADDRWNDLEEVFYLTFNPVSRFWFGDIKSSLGKMSGFDYYRNGQGRLSIRYVPSISFQEANDDKTTRSELITFMSEHVYNPSAFLNDYFTWLESTDSTVSASLTDAETTVKGTFYFNSEGFIKKFISTERFKGSGSEAIQETWEVILGEYQEFDGIIVPTWFNATWLLDSGPLEYINGNITEVRFDTDEL